MVLYKLKTTFWTTCNIFHEMLDITDPQKIIHVELYLTYMKSVKSESTVWVFPNKMS